MRVLNLEDFEAVYQRHYAAEKAWRFTVIPRVAAAEALVPTGLVASALKARQEETEASLPPDP